MDKTKALIASLAFAAGVGASSAISQPAKSNIEVVNVKLVRENFDGGYQWRGRACGYEVQADKRVAEPCWAVTVPISGSCMSVFEKQLLDQKGE